ncbi:D-glutamate cyclase family protein, partial [Bacillus altitudinis]|uniref:D-glutamate cyclase family protein n=1 Tax=Bacillus altitudinis TaxID=293387 RepID=UPI003B528908
MEDGDNVGMYETKIACERGGVLDGGMVVSMRGMGGDEVRRSVEVRCRLGWVDGGGMHIGDAGVIGIEDVDE